MKNIGLFFGSFNPIHMGHLILANYCLEYCKLDRVMFVVSPHNPFKDVKGLLPFDERYNMASCALSQSDRMMAVDWEKNLSLPSYTAQTMRYLSSLETVEDNIYNIIIGLDNFLNIEKWKDFDELFKYHLIVYPRGGQDKDKLFYKFAEQRNKLSLNNNLTFLYNAPLIDMSSTFIRNEVSEGRSISFYVPPVVENIIKRNKFYV